MGAHAARRYTTAVAQITLRAAHELATVVGQQPNAKFIEVLALLGPLLGPPASPPARYKPGGDFMMLLGGIRSPTA